MTAARIVPGSRKDVGLIGWVISQGAGLVNRTTAPNLFLTLGRHRKLFRGWLRFAGRLMPGGTLPRRETELVIIRVANLRSCSYELDHHLELGRRAGVTADDVTRLLAGPDDPSWSGWAPRERALLDAVEALHHRQDLTDAEWAALREHYDERAAIEVCFLAGHYEMLATVIQTLRIEPDRPRRRG